MAESPIASGVSTLPDDLDAHLASSEARIANIRPGLQKQIVWADPAAKSPTPYSIIYLHGFSSSLGEIRPVPDLVAGHLKANLFYARFDGHAADEEALGRTTTRAWVNDVVEAVAIGERIGERVIIMATSTGAALATWALGEPALARRVAAVVMLSPNYKLQSRGGWLLASPFARQIIRLALGRTRVIEPRNDLHARFWTIRYPTDALLPLTGAMQLANRTKFEEINVPALFAYSPDDDLVDPRRTLQIAGRWGAPNTLVTVPATPLSSHVLAGDALAPGNTVSVTRTVCDWLDRTLSR